MEGRLTRRALLGLSVLSGGGILAACSGGGGDSPDAAARRIAEPLAGGARNASLVGYQPGELRTLVEGLGHTRHTVTVVRVTGSGEKRQVIWRHAWSYGKAGTWEYDVSATLHRQQGTWKARWTPQLVHPALDAFTDRLTRRVVPQRRADILGNDDTALVTYRSVWQIGIDKSKTPRSQWIASAEKLAHVVGIDPARYSATVQAGGARQFVLAIVLRTDAVTAAQQQRILAVRGALMVPDQRPLAPTTDFARPVLGIVGPATAEIINASHGAISASEMVGLGGLQRRFDAQLRGTPGMAFDVTSATSHRRVGTLKGAPGRPLRTTLTRNLQEAAEQLLQAQTSASSIVAIRPSTGELLVMASGPGSQGYDTAGLGQYAPGSSFKIVSALAMLRGGQTVDGTVLCTPTVDVEGRPVSNDPGYPASALGDQPFRVAFAHSCNSAFIRGASRARMTDLVDAAAALGLTERFSPCFTGNVPDKDSDANHQLSMIGQGRVLASPLGVTIATASVVKGRRVTPVFLPGHDPAPAAPARKPLTSNEITSLRTMMRAVVTEGTAPMLRDLPGPPVLAKTGTAEYGDAKPRPRTHAWLTAAQGDLAVTAFVEDGGHGAATCGPIIRDFLRQCQSLDGADR